jgi:hypothetical protein
MGLDEGSAGTLFKRLKRATNDRNVPNGKKNRKKNVEQASPPQQTQSRKPTTILGKANTNLESKGKDRRQIG